MRIRLHPTLRLADKRYRTTSAASSPNWGERANHPVGVVRWLLAGGTMPSERGSTYAWRQRVMTELMLAVYASEDTAEHVLGVLLAQGQSVAARLESAIVLRRHADCDFTLVRTE